MSTILFSPLSFSLLFLQSGIDPTPYTAWGVLGALVFAFALASLLIWRLVTKQSEESRARDKFLMDWADTTRRESQQSMMEVSRTVEKSHERLANTLATSLHELRQAFDRQSNIVERSMLVSRVMREVEQMKRQGSDPDDTLIERVLTVIARKTNVEPDEG